MRAEDGHFVCDVLPEQAPPDATLWFDYDQFSTPVEEGGAGPDAARHVSPIGSHSGSPDQVQITHDSEASWIESRAHGTEDARPLVFYNIHRLAAGDG